MPILWSGVHISESSQVINRIWIKHQNKKQLSVRDWITSLQTFLHIPLLTDFGFSQSICVFEVENWNALD